MLTVRPSRKGAFYFAQACLPLLLEATSGEYPPTLIFTSATAAMKGSAMCSSFATGKFAMRALAQSLAREFGPKGVHVAHAIIDGVIDIERTKDWKFDAPDAKISPHSVSSQPQHPKIKQLRSLGLIGLTHFPRLRIHTGICTLNPGRASPMSSTFAHTLKSGRALEGLEQTGNPRGLSPLDKFQITMFFSNDPLTCRLLLLLSTPANFLLTHDSGRCDLKFTCNSTENGRKG